MTIRFPFDLSLLQSLAERRPAKQAAPSLIRSIQVAGHIIAQGTLVRQFDDGRIAVDAGGKILAGWPIQQLGRHKSAVMSAV